MIKRTGSVVLLSLVVIVMLGCEKKEDPLLDREKARVLISKYLENPRYDVNILVEIEHGSPQIADVVGRYQNKIVAVKYGKTFINVSPTVSPKIDYFLEFPPGNELFVKSAMESLQYAEFTPVLARRKDLGIIPPFHGIHGSFRVRSGSEGECNIEGKNITYRSTVVLDHNSADMFSIPTNSGFGLLEKRDYKLVCSFSNEEGLSNDDLLVAYFSMPKYDAPEYKGGLLKNMFCALNTEKRLDANFISQGHTLDVLYYREGSVMNSNIFSCDELGDYTVKAIAIDENGIKTESPEVTINVTFIPAEFWMGMGMYEY